MTRRPLACLLPVVLLAGCASVGESGARPEIRLPERFAFAVPPDSTGPAAPQALAPLDDPAFRALMDHAETAPDLSIALARIDAARAVARRAMAERLPSLDIAANAGVARSNPEQFGNLPAGIAAEATRFSIGGDISARWDPDLFGQLRAGQRAADARLEAATFDARAVRIAIASEVAAAVIDWRTVRAQRDALASSIGAARQSAGLIRERVAAGLNPERDVLRAEADLESLRARMAPLNGEEARIVARMVALTAMPAEAVLDALGRSDSAWSAGSSPETAPSALIAARPDIQAAAARLAASDADLAATAARRFPRLALSSTIGLLAFSLGGLSDSEAITGQLGAGIAGPLLDFGRIAAEIDRDKAQARAAFEELRKATFAALGEAEGSLGALAAADREAEAIAAQATRESDVARLTASRQRTGLDSMIAVLDADRAAHQARQQAIAAAGRALRARLALWQSLGAPGLEQPAPSRAKAYGTP